MTELHEVATERVEPEHIQYDLQRLFARRKNVRLVTDTVTGIDKKAQTVTTEHGSYQYDQLLISLGGNPMTLGLPVLRNTASNCGPSNKRWHCVLTYLQLFGGGGGARPC